MADAAARREARRRKILENSENRLQRITGHIKIDQTEDHQTRHCQQTPATASLDPSESHLRSQSLINSSWDDPMQADDEIIDEGMQSCLRKRNFTLGLDNGAQETENIYPKDEDYSQVSRQPTEPKPTDTPSSFTNILRNRLIYVALAVLMNALLVLKLDKTFGASVIVPFFVLLASRLWLYGLSTQRENGSILLAALILCNVRPNVIHTLKSMINLLSHVIKDLSLFIFSFTMIYCMISSHWLDVPPPSTVEIVSDERMT